MQGIHVAAVGKLGTDGELKFTANGTAVMAFSLAVPGSKEGEETPWLRVSVWAELAEELSKHGRMTKGAECYVSGKLKLDAWTAPDGTPRTGLSVSAWECVPLGVGRKPNPNQQRQQQNNPPMGAHPQAGRQRGAYAGISTGNGTRQPYAPDDDHNVLPF